MSYPDSRSLRSSQPLPRARFKIAGALLLVGLACTLVGAGSGELFRRVLGASETNISREKYRIPSGITVLHKKLGDPKTVRERRRRVLVPTHLGSMVSIVGVGESTVFWFQDAQGRYRNVIVPQSDQHLYVLENYKTRVSSTRAESLPRRR